jgi:hypothetical protein
LSAAVSRRSISGEGDPGADVSRAGRRWRAGVRRERRERLADWMIVIGAVALFASLFLTWSHQFSPGFLVRFGTASQLADVPRDPTAWQVYSAMDVVLAVALAGVALAGGRAARLCALAAAIVGIVFVAHAVGTPPTNGANIFSPSVAGGPAFQSSSPAAGVGETVALVGLGLAVAGLLVSFTAE